MQTKVAEINEKIRNCRIDFEQKLSTEIIKNHDVICIEDLNVKGMMKNRKLAKVIGDAHGLSYSSISSSQESPTSTYFVRKWGRFNVLLSDCHPPAKGAVKENTPAHTSICFALRQAITAHLTPSVPLTQSRRTGFADVGTQVFPLDNH